MQVWTEGENPGVGRYRCTACGWIVRLDEDSDHLPECRGRCPAQSRTEYRRIGSGEDGDE